MHGRRRRGSDGALARSSHVGRGSARYELLGIMGKLREGRKGSERASVVVGHGELQLRRASDDGGNDNAATPEVGRLRGDDNMIEELKAELWVRWSEARCGDERARARRSSRRQ